MVNKQKNRIYCIQHQEEVNKYFSEYCSLDNEKVAESTSAKYLGVVIDSKLKFDGEVKDSSENGLRNKNSEYN